MHALSPDSGKQKHKLVINICILISFSKADQYNNQCIKTKLNDKKVTQRGSMARGNGRFYLSKITMHEDRF